MIAHAQGGDVRERALRVNVACMSRAGREPGFKKTNQDNCFAFEKYITEDQSLFGAMDGHGPHGTWACTLHAATLPQQQRCALMLLWPALQLLLCSSGHLVSGYVKQHLPIILVNHLTTERDVRRALTSGFVEVDKSLANSRIDCEFSGSTAVVSYLKVGNHVIGNSSVAGATTQERHSDVVGQDSDNGMGGRLPGGAGP